MHRNHHVSPNQASQNQNDADIDTDSANNAHVTTYFTRIFKELGLLYREFKIFKPVDHANRLFS